MEALYTLSDTAQMRSGGGVLGIATLQLLVGLILLGIYEKYKVKWYTDFAKENAEQKAGARIIDYMDGSTPLDYLFYISIFNNIFSVFGLAGIIYSLKELVMAFFAFNAIQLVVAFHYFVDVVTVIRVKSGEFQQVQGIEKSAAAFMFFNFILSLCAAGFAVRAVEEIKVKQREEYNRLSVLSDTLQYDADNEKP